MIRWEFIPLVSKEFFSIWTCTGDVTVEAADVVNVVSCLLCPCTVRL